MTLHPDTEHSEQEHFSIGMFIACVVVYMQLFAKIQAFSPKFCLWYLECTVNNTVRKEPEETVRVHCVNPAATHAY